MLIVESVCSVMRTVGYFSRSFARGYRGTSMEGSGKNIKKIDYLSMSTCTTNLATVLFTVRNCTWHTLREFTIFNLLNVESGLFRSISFGYETIRRNWRYVIHV